MEKVKRGDKKIIRKSGSKKIQQKSVTTKKNLHPKKVFLYALGLATLGGGAYFAYDRLKKKQSDNSASDDGTDTIVINNNIPSASNNYFRPKTKSTSTSSTVQIVFNPSDIALKLYRAAQNKNLDTVLSLLKQLKSVSDYSSVSTYYKKQGLVSKTVVTDLLDYAFKSDEVAKQQIRNEFSRMGLKMDSSGKWSLQGFSLYKDLITLRRTVVTDAQNNKIVVSKNTILGDEIQVSSGMTWFRSIDNSILKVPTQDVKHTTTT